MRVLSAIVLAGVVAMPSGGTRAQSLPVPPCAGAPHPAAGAPGESLTQLVWIDDDAPTDWSPPACTGWTAGPTKALLAAAGRFEMAGDTAVFAGRLARISGLRDIIYWSASRNRWRSLFEDAAALSAPDRDRRRADFTADELAAGAELYYWLEEDNPTAGVVYRLVIHERRPDRLVFESVNLTPLAARLLVFGREVAPPGEYRQLYYIEREAGDTWRYYSLIRMGRAGSLAGTSAANYMNRAEAYFRYLAGLPMDREPPAAP